MASVCREVYKVFRSWQDFFREKILFSRNTDVVAGMGTQQKKVFWSAMRVVPFLVDAVFGKTVEGYIKTGLFRKGPFGPALEQSR